jgi:outer membrane protein assembly factor BamB
MRTILALLILSTAASAQDWPGWRGAARDGRLTGFKPPAEWPKELKQGWQIEVGEGHASPALVDGRLYVFVRRGGDEVLACLDASTGKELWKDAQPVDFTPENAARAYGKGPFASPIVADGRVYTFGIAGLLACLDAKTGKPLWRYDPKDDFEKPYPVWGTGLSPLVSGGLCIVHVGREKKGAVLALDAATGKEKWRWEGDGPSYASPIAATLGGKAQIVMQTEFHAIGLSAADGKLLWKTEFATKYEQNSVTPVVLGDLVLLSGYGAGVGALRPGADSAEWVWRASEASMFMSTPILQGERLYGFSEKGRGQLFCMDAKTGKALWIEGGRIGENAAIVDAGPVLVALLTPEPKDASKPSTLVVFDASENGYAERARYKVSDTPAFAHPVLSGKSIFVKGLTKLTQWTLP